MFRNFKSAIFATCMVLAAANAAMASDYTWECDGSGQSLVTSQPTTSNVNRHDVCGYTFYLSDYQVEKINSMCAGKAVYISHFAGATICQIEVGYNQ